MIFKISGGVESFDVPEIVDFAREIIQKIAYFTHERIAGR